LVTKLITTTARMADFAVPLPPKKATLTRQTSVNVTSFDNPFFGKGEDGKIYHLKPNEVGPGQIRNSRSYDSTTREKVNSAASKRFGITVLCILIADF